MSTAPASEEEPVPFSTLMQRFQEAFCRFADPAQPDRSEVEKGLVEAYDAVTEALLDYMLDMSPAELAQAYPLWAEAMSAGSVAVDSVISKRTAVPQPC